MNHSVELCCLCKRLLIYVDGKHVNDFYPVDLSVNYQGSNIVTLSGSNPGKMKGYLCAECMQAIYPLIRHLEIVASERQGINTDEAIEKLKVDSPNVELSPQEERLKPEEITESLKRLPGSVWGETDREQMMREYWSQTRKSVGDQMAKEEDYYKTALPMMPPPDPCDGKKWGGGQP